MKRAGFVWPFAVLVLVMSMQVAAPAQEEKVITVWDKLGVTGAFEKMAAFRDSVINRTGKHPQWEKKPPLKALADPANLESPNPAIKAAAEIKMDQDLKAQKIKAIRYLAKIGCGCYPEVKQALLDALEDCNEDVRYEAAIAFCEAGGNPCKACNQNSCCDAEVIAKLAEMAEGLDDNGCPNEPSARVRGAAANALNVCRGVVPPEIQETPTPAPREVPAPKEAARRPVMIHVEG